MIEIEGLHITGSAYPKKAKTFKHIAPDTDWKIKK